MTAKDQPSQAPRRSDEVPAPQTVEDNPVAAMLLAKVLVIQGVRHHDASQVRAGEELMDAASRSPDPAKVRDALNALCRSN